MTTTNTYGRQVVLPLTNKSGGGVIAGDVVVIDTSNNDAFTTSTAGAVTGTVGIAQETIASNAVGRVLLSGYAALVNVNASVTRGNYGKTYTVAKQATDAGSSRIAGTFCQFLTGGTTPDAAVWQPDLGGGTGLSDPMTTRGDIIVRNAANTTARLAVGATANMALTSDGTDVAYKLVPGTLIAIQKYAPAQTVFSATTTTFTDMDATNMAVTFTAPASGNVLVTLCAYHDVSAGVAPYQWCLREGSSIVPDSVCFVNRDGGVTGAMMSTVQIYLTGVSAGSHTYKWAHAIGATVTTGRTIVGPGDALSDFGAGIMAVFAA